MVAVIGIILIEGLWLAGLTYLMWRRKRGVPKDTQAPAPKPD